MAKIILFVYGTLKRGFAQNRRLGGQEFLGEVRTLPHYRLFDNGSHPCLVADARQGQAVQGELWRVDHSLLASLDAYEGVPVTFRRQEIQIAGQSEPVWAYFYQGDVSGMKDCGESWSPKHV
jgi:gamma-glutamylcyclotransferase (GGCT)/AIG2-like uncharacterized protein YtfP